MATVYLAPSPTGDDSRTYAQAQNPATPWATVAKVQASATSGDTCLLAAGTYPAETVNFGSKTLTFTGVGTVIFEGSGNAASWYAGTFGSGFTLTCNNLTFQNIKQPSAIRAIFAQGNGVSQMLLVMNNCNLLNMVVDGNGDVGGVFGQESGGGTGFGLRLSGCKVTLSRNAAPSGTYASLIGSRGTSIQSGSYLKASVFYSSGTGATNLTRWFNGQSAAASPVLTITDCIFDSAEAVPLFYFSGYTEASTPANYTCVHNVTSGNPTTNHSITSDPKLIDPAAGDFHLAQDSPCRGAGTYL